MSNEAIPTLWIVLIYKLFLGFFEKTKKTEKINQEKKIEEKKELL